MRAGLIAALAVLLSTDLCARVILVPEEYADVDDLASVLQAFDTVSVAAGVYDFGTLDMSFPVSFIARDSAAVTVFTGYLRYPAGPAIDTAFIEGIRFTRDNYQLHTDGANLWAIRRCVFENSAGVTVQIRTGGGVIENCLFRDRAWGLNVDNADVIVRNNIFVNCSDRAVNAEDSIVVKYNCFFANGADIVGNVSVEGNVFADPLIDDSTFAPDPSSPCIDAGDPASTVPLGGGARVDIGVVEYIGALFAPFNLVHPKPDTVLPSTIALFMWELPIDTGSLEVYDEFRLLLWSDAVQDSLVDTVRISIDTMFVDSLLLVEGNTYVWRVEAQNDTGGIAYSPIWRFRVAHFPSAATQVIPSAGATVHPDDWLEWFHASDADVVDTIEYRLEFALDAGFAASVLVVEGIRDSTGGSAISHRPLGAYAAGDSIFAVRLSNLSGFEALLDDSVYYWRVKSRDRYGAEAEWAFDGRWFSYQAANTPPGVITSGFSPADSEQVLSLLPNLSWYPPSDPDDPQDSLYYTVQLDDDGEFINDTRYTYVTGLGQPSLFVPDSLVDHTLWSWRVQAKDVMDAASPWSDIQYFWTNSFNDPPTAFALQAPVDDTIVYTLAPRLTWGASTDPDPLDSVSYLIDLAVDENFTFRTTLGPVLNESIVLTDSLALNTGYWWRVRAIDAYGKTTESDSTFAFRTFLPGDWDLSTDVTTGDIIAVINFIFRSGPAYGPIWLGDVDQSCNVTAADAIYLVGYVFKGGLSPRIGCE